MSRLVEIAMSELIAPIQAKVQAKKDAEAAKVRQDAELEAATAAAETKRTAAEDLAAKIAETKAKLDEMARRRGIDRPVDPAVAEARKKNELVDTLLDGAAKYAQERRDMKARKNAQKALRKLGL